MEDRLGRLENKIDKLAEAVVSLARVEEQLITVFKNQTHMEQRIESIDSKVDGLAESMAEARTMERLIWVVVVAAVGAAFTYIGNS